MMIPNGLELKYESARYPKPPPTIRAATSSTPIRAAIARPSGTHRAHLPYKLTAPAVSSGALIAR